MKNKEMLAKLFVAKNVAKEFITLNQTLMELEEKFYKGISGTEILEAIETSIELVGNITEKSNRVVVIDGEEFDVDIISVEPLMRMAFTLTSFVEVFPIVCEEYSHEEADEFVDSFFGALFECMDQIDDEIKELSEEAEEMLDRIEYL